MPTLALVFEIARALERSAGELMLETEARLPKEWHRPLGGRCLQRLRYDPWPICWPGRRASSGASGSSAAAMISRILINR
jgi:hypothetical protein